MHSRERVQTAFSRHTPDRVPVFAEYVPEVKNKLLEYFKTDDPHKMSVAIGNDMLVHSAGIATSCYGPSEEYVCPWGCTWKYFANESGSYTEIIRHPLGDDPDGEKLRKYTIPDPDAPEVYLPMRRLVKEYGKTHFLCGAVPCSFFEAAWYTHGLEETMMDMVLRPDYVEALFDKVMQFPLRAGTHMVEEGADMIWLGDDVGMQERMIMSPVIWRQMLKPRLATLISAFKKKNRNVLVAYHSCGNIEPIIGDLIEIGLDVLNPIQPLAMDAAELKRKYGDRLSFWGSICIQKTLPYGSIDDIRNEVRQRMETIGKGGGLLLGPAHNVQADTSLTNLLAFYDAARELGVYR